MCTYVHIHVLEYEFIPLLPTKQRELLLTKDPFGHLRLTNVGLKWGGFAQELFRSCQSSCNADSTSNISALSKNSMHLESFFTSFLLTQEGGMCRCIQRCQGGLLPPAPIKVTQGHSVSFMAEQGIEPKSPRFLFNTLTTTPLWLSK